MARFTGGAAGLTWILTARCALCQWAFDFASGCRARPSGLKTPRQLMYPAWACKCPFSRGGRRALTAASLAATGCAQSRPFSIASQACVPSCRPALRCAHNALLGCFSFLAENHVPALDWCPQWRRLELMLARGYGVLSRHRFMATPSHAFRSGPQRLGFRSCGSLSHIGELDADGVFGPGSDGVHGLLVRASQWPCEQVQGVEGLRRV